MANKKTTYVELYHKLIQDDLTPQERMLIAAILKRMSISKTVIDGEAFAGNLTLNMAEKQTLEEFQ
jgi:hypothetical protein